MLNFDVNYTGGKKNRQKERRLMKGFNLAPPTATPSMTTLPPVAEFISSFDQSTDQPDFYGSTFSGILSSGITPRRNHMYSMHSMQQFSSSQSSFSESFGPIGKLGKLGSKLRHHSSNNTAQKRRWGIFNGLHSYQNNLYTYIHKTNYEKFSSQFFSFLPYFFFYFVVVVFIIPKKKNIGTLIDAARSGTDHVSRFIRSRSEDSVCNTVAAATNSQIRESISRSNSPGSDEGITASPTDSNPSMDKPEVGSATTTKFKQKEHHTHLYGKQLNYNKNCHIFFFFFISLCLFVFPCVFFHVPKFHVVCVYIQ